VYPGAHAKTQPDKPALIMAGTGRTITFAELDERSNRLAQWWYAAGLRTGDGVATLVTNIPETLEILICSSRLRTSSSLIRRSWRTCHQGSSMFI
jgi:fatty-acyl-CoA synthase